MALRARDLAWEVKTSELFPEAGEKESRAD